jgi:hypothetical protein
LELDDAESEALQQVLRHALATLEVEILHTDHADFRRVLRDRRELLARVSARLTPASPPAR